MTTSRFLCPLDCGWHHDRPEPDFTKPQPFATVPAPDGVDPIIWGYALGQTLTVEQTIRAHCETHELIEWVTALQAAKQRADKAEAAIERVRAILDPSSWARDIDIIEALEQP